MGWSTTEQKTERVEDTNPDVWVMSSEESIKNGDINEALYKIDKAISYSNEKSHYLFEKVKILNSCGKYHEAIQLICTKMKSFKKDFEGTEKLHRLFDYYDEAIKLSMRNAQGMHETLNILYSHGMYEKFVELLERNIRTLSTFLTNREIELVLVKLYTSIVSITGKALEFYISKIILLYNYNSYERFLELTLNMLSKNFEKIDKFELKRLLEYVDKSMNYVKDKEKYAILRIKILFSLGKYGECIDNIYTNMHYLMQQDEQYTFDCLVRCFERNDNNDMHLFNKILILLEKNRTKDFIQVVYDKIDNFYNNVNKDEFDKILKYVVQAISRNFNNASKNSNYKYMKVLIKYKKYDEFLNLLEYGVNHDFMEEIERDVHIYKEKLSEEQFNRVLRYFYNTTKNQILKRNVSSHYKFDKIKFLYNYKKYNECFDILNNCIDDFSKTLDAHEYNEALKYLKRCYFKEGKILSGIGFIVLSPIRHPNRYNVCRSFIIILLLAAAWHFNILYNSGILKPEIVDVQIITAKKIIGPGEAMEYQLQVTTKPKNVWKYKYEIKSANKDIIKIEDIKIIAGPKEGKTDLIAIVTGANQKDFKLNLEVKKPIVKSIELNIQNVNLLVGEDVEINANIIMNYENAIKPDVKYTSKNQGVVTVDDVGSIRAIAAGNSKIVVEAGGKKSYISVKVESMPLVKALEVNLEKTQLSVGESEEIYVNVTMNSEDISMAQVLYSVDNNNIKIDENGWIMALQPGFTSITVRCGEKEQVINVEVVDINVVSEEPTGQNNGIGDIYSDFIFPNSDVEEIVGSNLFDLDVQTLSIARNEIFARHGFVFENLNLQNYFEDKSWYIPNLAYKGDNISEIEDSNSKLIKTIEVIKIASGTNNTDYYSDYILLESSARKLSKGEIEALNDWEVILARNEIFARHGFIFGIPELKDFFEAKYWYTPDQYYNGYGLDAIEEYNIQLIKKVEEVRINKMLKNQLQ